MEIVHIYSAEPSFSLVLDGFDDIDFTMEGIAQKCVLMDIGKV